MLQIFKQVPVVTDAHRSDALPAHAEPYMRDTITLGWEERVKARARRRSDSGAEFATALPRGAVLREGDVFVIDELALVATVIERAEPVLVVRPTSSAEWGLYGYYIGNSHQPLMVDGHVIVCADLPGMEQVLDQYGIPFVREMRAFTPVSGTADHSHAR